MESAKPAIKVKKEWNKHLILDKRKWRKKEIKIKSNSQKCRKAYKTCLLLNLGGK